MAKRQRSGKGWKSGYTAYKAESRFIKNREIKLERHIKVHPNDNVALEALTRSLTKPRRGKPRNPGSVKAQSVLKVIPCPHDLRIRHPFRGTL